MGLPPVEIVAFVFAVIFCAVNGLAEIVNPPSALELCLFAYAAIGIRSRQAWASYGCALVLLVGLVHAILAISATPLRGSSSSVTLIAVSIGMLIRVAIPVLFFFSGGSARKSGGTPGWAWPWIAYSALALIMPFFFHTYLIPTGSMENTLQVGDRIVAQDLAFGPIRHNDLIVFRSPAEGGFVTVKRAVALAGDRIHFRRKRLVLNGKTQDEPFAIHQIYPNPYLDEFPAVSPNWQLKPSAADMLANHVVNRELVVPAGKLFLAGDNRELSFDSRFVGFIDESNVIGKARFIYFSLQGTTGTSPGRVPPTIFRARWDRFLLWIR